MNSVVKQLLQKFRFLLHAKGYEIFPVDSTCWSDQKQLLEGTPIKCIIDAGANSGQVTQKYRSMFPDAKIHCFEPQENFVTELKQRFGKDTSIIVKDSCLGRIRESRIFYINQAPDTSSLLAPLTGTLTSSWAENLKVVDQRTVEVISLDKYAAKEKASTIQILKMDTQGSELEILKGAKTLLSKGKIDLIYTEVSFAPMYRGHALFDDVAKYLHDFGYSFHFSYNNSFSGRSGKLLFADAIFVSPRLKKRSKQLLATYTSKDRETKTAA